MRWFVFGVYLVTVWRNMSFIEGSCSSKRSIVPLWISSFSMLFAVLLSLRVNSAWVRSFSSLKLSKLAVLKSFGVSLLQFLRVAVYLLVLNCLRMLLMLPERTTCDLLMSAMFSQRRSTESMLWVEKITVAPLFFSSKISFLSSSAFMGSNPLNGSSNISSSGSWSTVVMNWTFCAIPFDSSSTFLFHHVSISNFSNQYFSRLSASVLDSPFS